MLKLIELLVHAEQEIQFTKYDNYTIVIRNILIILQIINLNFIQVIVYWCNYYFEKFKDWVSLSVKYISMI